MNREEITRMATEAGVRAVKLLHEFGTEGALCDSEIQDLRAAERLAEAAYAAGAAAEREACAKVCDEQANKDGWEGSYAHACAEAIRARGETK